MMLMLEVIWPLSALDGIFENLAYAAEVNIKAGTPIPVRLLDDLSSETANHPSHSTLNTRRLIWCTISNTASLAPGRTFVLLWE